MLETAPALRYCPLLALLIVVGVGAKAVTELVDDARNMAKANLGSFILSQLSIPCDMVQCLRCLLLLMREIRQLITTERVLLFTVGRICRFVLSHHSTSRASGWMDGCEVAIVPKRVFPSPISARPLVPPSRTSPKVQLADHRNFEFVRHLSPKQRPRPITPKPKPSHDQGQAVQEGGGPPSRADIIVERRGVRPAAGQWRHSTTKSYASQHHRHQRTVTDPAISRPAPTIRRGYRIVVLLGRTVSNHWIRCSFQCL